MTNGLKGAASSATRDPACRDRMQKERSAPRHRVLKGGQIRFGQSAIDCVIRDLSATGARIKVNSPLWSGLLGVMMAQPHPPRHPAQIIPLRPALTTLATPVFFVRNEPARSTLFRRRAKRSCSMTPFPPCDPFSRSWAHCSGWQGHSCPHS